MNVYLSLGSNLGEREDTLNKAIEMIGEKIGKVTAVSRFIETEAVGFASANKFINCAICIDTELDPLSLLHSTQEIERALGRTKKTIDGVYTDRTIDIDILLYGDLKINNAELKIPHPHMRERDFVMVPLKEIFNNRRNACH